MRERNGKRKKKGRRRRKKLRQIKRGLYNSRAKNEFQEYKEDALEKEKIECENENCPKAMNRFFFSQKLG